LNEPAHRPLKERLAVLAEFGSVFARPDCSFGEWGGGKQTAPGNFTMPYVTMSDEPSRFVKLAYEYDWVKGDFNWGAWKGTPEAIALRDEPGAIGRATSDQLAKLLTVLVRQDRFVEGALRAAFTSGMLTAIVQRAAAILDATHQSEKPPK